MATRFEQLEALRLQSREILAVQEASLKRFALRDGGFCHTLSTRGREPSVSSSATCILSLVANNVWDLETGKTKKLLKYLLSRNTSAGLKKNNPFTNAWIIEAVRALEKKYPKILNRKDRGKIERKEAKLLTFLADGGVGIEPYPPSGYLTQLAMRALLNGRKPDESWTGVKSWAWAELSKQLALIEAKSKAQDAFAVAYLLITVSTLTPPSEISPEQASIQKIALRVFFDCQLQDGTWPLSRPLFHYPAIGNAHCYEYEMLVQLFQTADLADVLVGYLDKIELTATSAISGAYRFGGGTLAWSSGHHPQVGEPESWATASVFHFFYCLDRLLARWVRSELYRYLELPAPSSGTRQLEKSDFAPGMIDSSVTVKQKTYSLKQFLWSEFVRPIVSEVDLVEAGGAFSAGTPRSAIFFGPPGTSKTDLSTKIAAFLGWSYLAIDPSMLLRNGMEGIQAEANTIFRMLDQTDSIVVLFDEFDELVRERDSPKAELPFSRLLTTAMLPKLAAIHKRGAVVFIIATNNISAFDLAISREGRFDLVLQIMPPTYSAKMAFKHWGPERNLNLRARFKKLGIPLNRELRQKLADLTFGEFQNFANDVAKASAKGTVLASLNNRWADGTLQRHVPKPHVDSQDEITWKERCKLDQSFNR